MPRMWKLALLGAACALAVLPGLPAGAESEGEEVWLFCQQCHGPDGGGNRSYLAPSIAGLPEWYVQRQLEKFHSGIRGTNFDDLSGMRMRPMALWLKDEAQTRAAAAHVAGMPPVKPEPGLEGGSAERGQALYATCVACHGPQGGGNEALGAPPLNHQSDWYMLTQLVHFKLGIRGANPQDTQGAVMRNFAMLLQDEQAMKDVIAYIMTFPVQSQTAKNEN